MKTFLINLDKDVERLAAADAQLKRLGIEYERFPAVYGKNLSRVEMRKHVSTFRSWSVNGRMYTPGQVGCTLSHIFIYQRMVEENIPMAMVFEDDVTMSDDMPRMMAFVEKELDASRPQWVLFSDHSRGHSETVADSADAPRLVRCGYDFCTEAYALTLAAAKAVLRVNYPMNCMCDSYPRWAARKVIELYHAKPTSAIQNREDFGSNLGYDGIVGKKGMRGVRRIGWGINRGCGKCVDWFLYKITGR